jgi:ATP-dependent Clp protease adaptor protein ClpS
VQVEVLGFLLAGAGAAFGLWAWQRRGQPDRHTRAFEAMLDADAAVALALAKKAAGDRGHPSVLPLHLLYGLVEDEKIVAAIARLEGNAQALEDRITAELDKLPRDTRDAAVLGQIDFVLGVAYQSALSSKQPVTCTSLLAYLLRTGVAKLVEEVGKVSPHALLFVLVHGMPEPLTDLPDRTDVHVILRNDDYTTREFVVELLREVFELPEAEATARMEQTHDEGRAIVGRYKLARAQELIAAARTRAKAETFPLWVGVEDC